MHDHIELTLIMEGKDVVNNIFDCMDLEGYTPEEVNNYKRKLFAKLTGLSHRALIQNLIRLDFCGSNADDITELSAVFEIERD